MDELLNISEPKDCKDSTRQTTSTNGNLGRDFHVYSTGSAPDKVAPNATNGYSRANFASENSEEISAIPVEELELNNHLHRTDAVVEGEGRSLFDRETYHGLTNAMLLGLVTTGGAGIILKPDAALLITSICFAWYAIVGSVGCAINAFTTESPTSAEIESVATYQPWICTTTNLPPRIHP